MYKLPINKTHIRFLLNSIYDKAGDNMNTSDSLAKAAFQIILNVYRALLPCGMITTPYRQR